MSSGEVKEAKAKRAPGTEEEKSMLRRLQRLAAEEAKSPRWW